ncbi:MAG: dipeptidase [Bacteroidota bacterium]
MRISGFLVIISFLLHSCGDGVKKRDDDYINQLHDKILTVDSHTDTPLQFMREGYDFFNRQDAYQDGSRVDFPRIQEGSLDGVFLAVFLGQKERTEEGYIKAKARSYEYFDSIYAQLERGEEKIELALNPRDFKKIVRKGKHAIFIGLENGYPIGHDISMVDTFYHLGARYITLCHTKNNDICDSSTDEDGPEFNGLSDFGYEVVKRMNKLGMMIDVSHASDEAFYDVIEASAKPVIASHSCAKALCDNPRNMDDDMLRTLAKNGGVIQMCILSAYVEEPEPDPLRDSAKNAVYEKHGNYYDLDEEGRQAFLKDWYAVDKVYPPKLADVSKVVDHIDHIVEVAGIDHVGIGTDFDGGGGVDGCYDVSEIKNITAELVERGYSRREIEKIWSGNLMRVMGEQ